jgi:pre-rRNA-processing protein TSR2
MDTSSTKPQSTTIEIATAEFHAGVTAILRSWSPLKTAVESEWGGTQSKEKAEYLRTHMLTCFDYTKQKPSIDMYDLEDDLAIFMEEEFSIVLEDNSEKQIAQLLFKIYEMCGNGNFSLARELILKANQTATVAGQPVVQSNGELDEDSDEEMDTAGTTNTTNVAQEYAGDFLFGAPAGQGQKAKTGPPPRQLGTAAPEKPIVEVDDDGFATVPSKKKGNR